MPFKSNSRPKNIPCTPCTQTWQTFLSIVHYRITLSIISPITPLHSPTAASERETSIILTQPAITNIKQPPLITYLVLLSLQCMQTRSHYEQEPCSSYNLQHSLFIYLIIYENKVNPVQFLLPSKSSNLIKPISKTYPTWNVPLSKVKTSSTILKQTLLQKQHFNCEQKPYPVHFWLCSLSVFTYFKNQCLLQISGILPKIELKSTILSFYPWQQKTSKHYTLHFIKSCLTCRFSGLTNNFVLTFPIFSILITLRNVLHTHLHIYLL